MSEHGIVLVPVLENHLYRVYEFLVTLSRETGPDEPPQLTTAPVSEGILVKDFRWTRAELVSLYRQCRPVPRAIVKAIALAGRRREAASYGSLREAGAAATGNAEFNFDQVRVALGWISKHAQKSSVGGAHWPFAVETVRRDGPQGDRHLYKMPVELAEQWLQIAEEEE